MEGLVGGEKGKVAAVTVELRVDGVAMVAVDGVAIVVASSSCWRFLVARMSLSISTMW